MTDPTKLHESQLFRIARATAEAKAQYEAARDLARELEGPGAGDPRSPLVLALLQAIALNQHARTPKPD